MYQYLDYLENQYPDKVTIEDIGKSSENRTLRVVKVSTGPNKPAIWIDAGQYKIFHEESNFWTHWKQLPNVRERILCLD